MTFTDASIYDPHIIEISRFRKNFYQFFSRVYSEEADLALLADAKKILQILDDLPELSGPEGNADLHEGARKLEAFFKRNPIENLIVDDLAIEYAGLFLGVGCKNTVHLCESSYGRQNNFLFQDSYFTVKDLFEKTGFQRGERFAEPDDHLSLELAFMAELCTCLMDPDNIKKDPLKYLAIQRRFISEHLQNWVPAFSQKLREVAPSSLYTACSKLLKGYLQTDSSLINIQTEDYHQKSVDKMPESA